MALLYVVLAILGLLVVSVVVAQTVVDLGPLLKSDREIARAAREGKMLLALMSYRTLHSVGLKRAKAAVAKLAAEGEAPEQTSTLNDDASSKQ